jgi:type II secretory pathway pseudopilin PulG
MMRRKRPDLGFSLIEALIASTILLTGLSVLAQLFGASSTSSRRSELTTSATVLAIEKMEQLRGLAWGFDALGLARSDFSSDIAAFPERATGGGGLTLSPAGTLATNTLGYCDFVDVNHRALGGGVDPPAGAHYLRRWSIDPLPADPDNALVIQVVVSRATSASVPAARLVTVKTRKSS